MLLQLQNVSKNFGGVAAVTGISFHVKQGEILGIIGPNGAGKTTIFNLITGVFPVSEGTIVFDRHPLAGVAPHKVVEMGVARTFQNIRLYGTMTALETVLVGMHCRTGCGFWSSFYRSRRQRIEEERIRRLAMDFLRFVGLEQEAQTIATSLPYGKQRRLEIARAMATYPQLILLDEPAAGMNDRETEELQDLIQRIHEQGIAIVIIEHDMGLMMSLCNRLVVLNFGEKIAEGTPAEIQQNEKVIEAYLGKDV